MLCLSRYPPRPLRAHPSQEGMAAADLLEGMADARKRNATPKKGYQAPLELNNLPYHLFPISYQSPSLPFTKIYNGRQ